MVVLGVMLEEEIKIFFRAAQIVLAYFSVNPRTEKIYINTVMKKSPCFYIWESQFTQTKTYHLHLYEFSLKMKN